MNVDPNASEYTLASKNICSCFIDRLTGTHSLLQFVNMYSYPILLKMHSLHLIHKESGINFKTTSGSQYQFSRDSVSTITYGDTLIV